MSAALFWQIFPLWIKAFALTLLFEVPIYVWLGRILSGRAGHCVSMIRLAVAGVLGSCLTHPLLWFVWPSVVHDYGLYVISGELLVAIIESLIFYVAARPIRLRHAVITAFTANAVSVGLGYLCHFLGLA